MKSIQFSPGEINELQDFYNFELERTEKRLAHIKGVLKKIDKEGGNGTPLVAKAEKSNLVAEKSTKVAKEKKTAKKVAKAPKIPVAKVAKAKVAKAVNETAAATTEVVKRKSGRPKASAATAKPVVKMTKTPKVKAVAKTKVAKPKVTKTKVAKAATGKSRGRKAIWTEFILNTLKEKDSPLLASSLTRVAMDHFNTSEADKDKVRLAIAGGLTKLTNKDNVLKSHTVTGIRGSFFGLNDWFDQEGKLLERYQGKVR